LIILDTDVLIDVFDKRSERGDETVSKLETVGDEVWTTSLNLHEVLYGCLKTARPTEGVASLDTIAFTAEDARLSGSIEVGLEKKGAMVRRMDTMIAAIAINHGADLLTYDVRHFERMKDFGLRLFQDKTSDEGVSE
jgi:tRNA(fMet)-specific endonuclease VapC